MVLTDEMKAQLKALALEAQKEMVRGSQKEQMPHVHVSIRPEILLELLGENERLWTAVRTCLGLNGSNEFVYFVPAVDGEEPQTEQYSLMTPQQQEQVRRCLDGRLWYPRFLSLLGGPDKKHWVASPIGNRAF